MSSRRALSRKIFDRHAAFLLVYSGMQGEFFHINLNKAVDRHIRRASHEVFISTRGNIASYVRKQNDVPLAELPKVQRKLPHILLPSTIPQRIR